MKLKIDSISCFDAIRRLRARAVVDHNESVFDAVGDLGSGGGRDLLS